MPDSSSAAPALGDARPVLYAIPGCDAPLRKGRELIRAAREYASEDISRSTRATLSTMAAVAALWPLQFALPVWVQLITGVPLGLLLVRGFVLFHDYQHGALLRGVRWAKPVFGAFGMLVLTPPQVWRDTHNFHHANNAKLVGSHIGSFPTLSLSIWHKLDTKARRAYVMGRHPLVILFAYLTVFLIGMCISPLRRNPRRNKSAAFTLALHFALGATAYLLGGPRALLLGLLLPLNVAFITGAYLFYAQHTFEGVELRDRRDWEFTLATLTSSSYMPMGPVMRWFTANIGYHHVHHLNSKIPFYRLPEAMAEMPELQHAKQTRLRPGDIVACLRMKLWDAERGEMVGYPR